MRRSSSETRDHVLTIAHELFYWNGIRAVGVDRIAAEARVAPTTLYRLFASKDDLVAAYISRARTLYQEWFHTTVAAANGPRAQILAVFDAQTEQIRPEFCRGCPFLMALAEFPDSTHPAHREAVATKAWVRDQFRQLTGALKPTTTDPGTLADQLVLVMEGAYASTHALGDKGPARLAADFAASLLPHLQRAWANTGRTLTG